MRKGKGEETEKMKLKNKSDVNYITANNSPEDRDQRRKLGNMADQK